MRVLTSPEETQEACAEVRRQGKRLGLVPTMGAVHEGHLSLVRLARAESEVVAVSIFVNPLQFAPSEDYENYPRGLDRDREVLEREHVDLVFAPSPEAMYPSGQTTYVSVEGLSDRLCGRSRPGHFRGVSTVVAKLLNIVQPSAAYFGQKDAAQVAIIRRMVRDLNFSTEIIVGPTVRAADGLALSSRNAYLSSEQRKSATVLYRVLLRIQALAQEGERSSELLKQEGHKILAGEPAVHFDYLEVVDPDTLDPVADVSGGALVAVAGYLGTTRLIDNIVLGEVGITNPHSTQNQP